MTDYMQRRFDKILEGLLPAGETALLAVSGGIDSVCLAELFAHSKLKRKFAVAHCNFHLRGQESDSDEALVRKWAEAAGVRLHKADFDTVSCASENSVSIEMAARRLRYDWFARLCKENGYYAVAVAHNANDNAETLMLNLLRGTGQRGLTGMRRCSEIPVSSADLKGERLIRPLLGFSRAEISEYAESNALEWHEDHTNAETLYKRNRIRHNVFPVFESINPSFLKTFSREMGIFSEINDIADDYFSSVSGNLVLPPAEGEMIRLDTEALKREKHWHYLLFRFLEPFGFHPSALESLYGIMESGTSSGHVLETSGYRLLTAPGRLSVSVREPDSVSVPCVGKGGNLPSMLSASENTCCVAVRTCGRYEFDRFNVRVDVSSLSGENGNPVGKAVALAGAGTLSADAAGLAFPFLLRGWRKGDWFRPAGLGGRKKLSDLFAGLKMDANEKAAALAVVLPSLNKDLDDKNSAGEHIAAVCGYASGRFFSRVDESVKVTGSTRDMVLIELLRSFDHIHERHTGEEMLR